MSFSELGGPKDQCSGANEMRLQNRLFAGHEQEPVTFTHLSITPGIRSPGQQGLDLLQAGEQAPRARDYVEWVR